MTSNPRSLTIKSLVDPIPAVGPSHFLQMKGHCFGLRTEGYNYEFCPFYNVSQRELSNRWNSYHGLLGVWSGWIYHNQSDYLRGMRYTFGDRCGSSYKNTTVIFECSETNNSLYAATEGDKCEFSLIFFTQLVCRDEWRAVFPHLEKEHKNDWLRIQLDYAMGILTEKGVCHGKHKILKKIGWIQELNMTRLRNDEAERESGKSLYERMPFNSPFMRHGMEESNECQTELTALRVKLSESQTLLQLINRTFQSALSSNQSDADIVMSLTELLAPCNDTEEASLLQLNDSVVSLQEDNRTTHGYTTDDSSIKLETKGERETVIKELNTLQEDYIEEEIDGL
eukprot:TRINITY_DN4846_c0_g2_i1.p1 TRINITY_DN4846_c0_g2~~TRINITY_DN4846_c0_g2_i1.p1  ORF type:complete len:364 (-),score=65.05 TRINITY_DN4846_c0_g2_i1:21-1040(-)